MAIQIALLRGINVGGKNKIKMAELREALETLGLLRVQTYIQSGNILFESDEDELTLRGKIEALIESKFGLSIRVIIRTADELTEIAANLPFSDEAVKAAEASFEGECLYIAMMLDEPNANKVEKLESYDFKEDRYVIAGRDVYLLFRQSVRDSKLSVQVDKLNAPVTVRNWNTLTKLIGMSQEMGNAN
ncbi:DUF1697 domain-containing protein [Paenibacillus sp. CF384]|uniref:DUF1697 domain-containing protein n=1 Tax=Paenibacillus sp. CF384 TaxID=1884382 RepID=UPI00089C58EA|nr:DUF1697 domain-containing protein [Paenibacillus sp. CF384]SDX37695.1 Uncharacterized conserved protein, DUF1697 family [Paenibacillus sp. CF384]